MGHSIHDHYDCYDPGYESKPREANDYFDLLLDTPISYIGATKGFASEPIMDEAWDLVRDALDDAGIEVEED